MRTMKPQTHSLIFIKDYFAWTTGAKYTMHIDDECQYKILNREGIEKVSGLYVPELRNILENMFHFLPENYTDKDLFAVALKYGITIKT